MVEVWPCRCGKLCRGSGLCPSADGSSAAAPPARCTVWLYSSASPFASSPSGSSPNRCRLHRYHLHRLHRLHHLHRLIGPALWEPGGTEDSSRMTLRGKKKSLIAEMFSRCRAWMCSPESQTHCCICGCLRQSSPIPRILHAHWWSRLMGARERVERLACFPPWEGRDWRCRAPPRQTGGRGPQRWS